MLSITLAAGLVLFRPFDASAQLSRVGNSQGVLIPPSLVRGTDVAYDPVRGVYLVVGANGFMGGVFTDVSGAIAAGTAQFNIGNAGGSANNIYAAYPRVKYSPDVNNGQGGFLVTWHQNDGKPNHVHAQVVAYPNGPASAEQQISDDTQGGSWWEAGAAVAYSQTSRKFFVTWQTLAGGWVQGRFVDLNGAPTGAIITFETSGARDPGLAWNAATDEFGLSNTGFSNSGAFAAFRRISCSSGAVSGKTTFGYSVGTFLSDVVVNPLTNHYLVGWSSSSGGNYAELDESGNLLGSGPIGLGTYDGFGIAFNAASGSLLAVGMGNSSEILGLEANGKGVPMSSAMALTNGGGTQGSYYPRATPRSNGKHWAISYSRQLVAGAIQIVATGTSLGGPVSDITMYLESPTTTLFHPTDAISVSGWALDKGSLTDDGVSEVHVWAVPAGGESPTLLGITSPLYARGDVANAFGGQDLNSGFSTSPRTLPEGSYTIVAYPKSTVTGTWGAPKSVSIAVGSAVPLLALDLPANNSAQPSTFTVSGWALDRFATSGTGVRAVHVWASSSGVSTFLGAATLGGIRTDVGNAFGRQFDNSGFNLTASLPAGTYAITAYMLDALTGTFAANRSATITIGASAPAMAIDRPTTDLHVSNGADSISGWAIDRGAWNGSGVAFVDVWAFSMNGAGQFLGRAAVGGYRPDVGAAFGSSQFNYSGYSQTILGLQGGQYYNLVVFAYSSVTGTFNQNRVVRVWVN